MNRIITQKGKKVNRKTYPPALRAFALTIQFYSTKGIAYYVRERFNLALPGAGIAALTTHQVTQTKPSWLQKNNRHRIQTISTFIYCQLMRLNYLGHRQKVLESSDDSIFATWLRSRGLVIVFVIFLTFQR